MLCKGESQYSSIGNSSIATPPWYPNLLAVSFSQPFPIPVTQRLLKNPKGKDHPMLINKSLALVAWKVTGKPWLNEAFQNELSVLSLTRRNKVCQRITINPGINGVAGVTGNKLIHFDSLSLMFSIFLHVCIKRVWVQFCKFLSLSYFWVEKIFGINDRTTLWH